MSKQHGHKSIQCFLQIVVAAKAPEGSDEIQIERGGINLRFAVPVFLFALQAPTIFFQTPP